jgi:hypothetical protein
MNGNIANRHAAPPSRTVTRLTARICLSSLCLLLAGLGLAEEPISKPDLSGTIRDEIGRPLPGATVFIYTAAPKDGPGILCPSCYVDCGKQATTGADGRFRIEDLDPELLLRVLVVGKGYQPEFVPNVDPAEQVVDVTLKPVSAGEEPNQRMRGRVVDAEGHPVPGAVVRVRGVTRGSSTRYGGNPDIDPVAVTDDAGAFVIHGREPFDAVGVNIEARGLAKRSFERLSTGDILHELTLTEGVSVAGRVLHEGEPLAGVEIGVAGADRSAGIFVGDFSVGTDDDGRFLFVNLPPRTDYYMYGIMRSLGERGAIPARAFRSEEDGSLFEFGDLTLQPGFKVEGRIRLADGEAVPENTRVLLARQQAWDSIETIADTEGRFRFAGVPAESISLTARVPGYTYSLRNASLDTLNPFRLIGRVHADKTDLIVELEPGDGRESMGGSSQALRQEPLRGAEAADPAGDIRVTGTVVDAGTGEPLPSFTVTEGREEPHRRDIQWFATRRSTHTDGNFAIGFFRHQQAPAVLIEADGYLPHASGLINVAETNLIVALQKGSGPEGMLLKPDGQPAGGVTVYLTDSRNAVYVSGEGMVVQERMYRGTRGIPTDDSGRFSFAPQVDANSVVVVDEAGYAEVTVEDLARSPEVRLKPWARVEGELRIGTRPGANETIRLGLPPRVSFRGSPAIPPLSLFLTTTTDAEGRFRFDRVPPVLVQIYHEPKVRDSRTGMIAQSQLTNLALEPGETHTVTIGGQGRPVIGQFVLKDHDGPIDWRADVHSLEWIRPQSARLPDLLSLAKEYQQSLSAALTEEEKEKARAAHERQREDAVRRLEEFHASDEGQEYQLARRRYALNFSQDGMFRVEDVPGGRYTLRVDLREPGADGPTRFSAPVIASLTQEIEVPDADGGRSDVPHDLGVIVVGR